MLCTFALNTATWCTPLIRTWFQDDRFVHEIYTLFQLGIYVLISVLWTKSLCLKVETEGLLASALCCGYNKTHMWSIQPFCRAIVSWLFDQGYSDVTDVEPLCSLTVQSHDPHRRSPSSRVNVGHKTWITNFVLRCLSSSFIFFLSWISFIWTKVSNMVLLHIFLEVVRSYIWIWPQFFSIRIRFYKSFSAL